MGGYDSIDDLRDVCEVLYDDIVFTGPDSIIYKEDSTNSYVILTRSNGNTHRRVFDELLQYGYEFVIGSKNSVWWLCNKYGEVLLNLGEYTPKWYNNIIIKVDTDSNTETVYRYEDNKVVLVREIKNGIASIVKSSKVDVIVIRNCVFNWESLINYNGDEILNDRSKLLVCEGGFVISYEVQADMVAVYKLIDGSKALEMKSRYTEAKVDVMSYPIVGVEFKDHMDGYKAEMLVTG